MRITKEEYEQLQAYKRLYEITTFWIMSNPSRFIEYNYWMQINVKELDASNS
jgi:hypothetical protein